MTTDNPQAEPIELERTGKPPLRFNGRLLTSANGQFVEAPKDKPNADFYTLSIYKAAGIHSPSPTYVVQIVYTKDFRGTQQHHTAIATDDPAATLGEYNPLAALIGFPPMVENRDERQHALESKCRRQYELLASAVLQAFPETLSTEATDSEPLRIADLEQAAAQLGHSEAGRATLRYLLDWLDDPSINLDGQNQEAVFTLLDGAWGSFSGTARDLMREQLRDTP